MKKTIIDALTAAGLAAEAEFVSTHLVEEITLAKVDDAIDSVFIHFGFNQEELDAFDKKIEEFLAEPVVKLMETGQLDLREILPAFNAELNCRERELLLFNGINDALQNTARHVAHKHAMRAMLVAAENNILADVVGDIMAEEIENPKKEGESPIQDSLNS